MYGGYVFVMKKNQALYSWVMQKKFKVADWESKQQEMEEQRRQLEEADAKEKKKGGGSGSALAAAWRR